MRRRRGRRIQPRRFRPRLRQAVRLQDEDEAADHGRSGQAAVRLPGTAGHRAGRRGSTAAFPLPGRGGFFARL
ncbi:hypothetical protein F01_350020 [Burkholderia cenocepacia]|nr:hypothetical protein F01_350020 [Burkholderia cenocepacia]